MNTFILEIEKNEKIETTTSGSRLDLIMKARKEEHDHAVVKNEKGRIIWQSHKNQ